MDYTNLFFYMKIEIVKTMLTKNYRFSVCLVCKKRDAFSNL